METLNPSERVPTKEELTRLVDGFAETVKCLMDVRDAQTETTEDVKRRHRDSDSMERMLYGSPRPLSTAAKFYRKTVLEDGTEIRFQFNPDSPLDDGAVPVKIDIVLPEDKHIKIPSLRGANLLYFGVSNYDERDSCDGDSPKPEKRLHGFQFVAGKNLFSKVLDVDGFSGISEDANNAIRLEVLRAFHKLIVDATYQPYTKPVRSWLQKLCS